MERTHPVTAAVYFLSVILITAIVQNPVFMATAFVCSALFAFMINRRLAVRTLIAATPVIVVAVLINMLFSNAGVTPLFRLPGGNNVTLETLIFSLFTAAMAVSLVMWFIGLNKCITTDKTVYLFGKLLPSLALLLSMTLRAVPMFARRAKQTAAAQRFVGNDIYKGTLRERIRSGVNVLSVAVTDTLEHSAYTARSMKYRGYGTAKRTAYSVFSFTPTDIVITAITVITAAGITLLYAGGYAYYNYYPAFELPLTAGNIISYSLWGILCVLPTATEIYTDMKRGA